MQKGFAHLLLLSIFALAVLAASGAYLFIFKNKPAGVIQNRMVPPVPPTKEQIKQSNIYKNDLLGFEFTIPEGFLVKEENEEDFHKRSNGDMRKNFAYYVKYPPADFVASLYVLGEDGGYDKAPLSVWVFENPDNLDAQAFYKKYWYYPFVWGEYSSGDKNKIAPDAKFMVGSAEGTGSAVLDLDPKTKFIYLEKADKMYLFRVTGDNDIPADFKFLN